MNTMISRLGVRLVIASGSRRRSPPASSSTTARRAATGSRPARCSTRSRKRGLHRRVRRRPPRRGEGSRQGAGLTRTATSSANGTRRTSGRLRGLCNGKIHDRRAHAHLPAVPTGPSSTCGTTSPARTSSSPRSTSPTCRRVFDAGVAGVRPRALPRLIR